MAYKTVYPIQIKQGMSSEESYLLILLEPMEDKRIPIIIGDNEAQAIIMAHEQAQTKRPTTHMLLRNIMKTFALDLKKVSIDRFEEGVFYATLHLTDGFNERHIDSRTSDAIALALMHGCNVEMDTKVIEETAILTDDMDDGFHVEDQPLSLEELQQMLAEAEEDEDYELAAQIQQQIENLNKEQ